MSRIYRVRIGQQLSEQLEQVCAAARVPVSTAIRLAVEHALNDPAAWQIFQRGLPFMVDTRTPQQQEAFVEYERQMQGFDMGTVLRECGLA
jgi:antitoxin component of RelBE/YafQ-DinJ toxin-antitoxin module